MSDLILPENKMNSRTITTDALSFVGDSVYSLLVRDRLVKTGLCHSNELHKASAKLVNAAAQACAYRIIEENLTEDETAVYKRGRNSHNNHKPKNAQCADYASATGIEALFGWLYLVKCDERRINELFEMIWQNAEIGG